MDIIGGSNWRSPIEGNNWNTYVVSPDHEYASVRYCRGFEMMHFPGTPGGGGFKLGRNRRRALIRTPVGVSGASQSAAMQLLVVAILILATLSALLIPTQLLLPSISIAGLAVAAVVALVAWHWKVVQDTGRLNLWDVSGLFAFIGFGACMLSDPDAVVQFFASGDVQPVGR